MIKNASPILTSLLDTDAYKFHMQQAVFHHHPNVLASAEFRCRNKDELGQFAEEIKQQIALMRNIRLTDQEYCYLASLPFFKTDYLDWLKNYRFQPEQVTVINDNGQLYLQFNGLWLDIILWEVPLLAMMSEIVHRYRTPYLNMSDAVNHLYNKLEQFDYLSRDLDMSQFQLVDFGTRRRYSFNVHREIVKTLQQTIPHYFCGTSNYLLAQQFNLSPVGTQAHEWFQAFQQISPELANSQREALQCWLDEYPNQLGIALTDCIAMNAFLLDFNASFAERYVGLRHDSGDPIEWGEKALAHYQKLGIDPRKKTLIFSDSLDLLKALQLYKYFHQKVKLVFGIGTQLTCDIPGIKPLNIVIKLVTCNNKPVAKISDSPGKTMCQDIRFVHNLRKAFNLPSYNKQFVGND